MNKWVIVNIGPSENTYWSNTDGWVDLDSATYFSDAEKDTLILPLGDYVVWELRPSQPRNIAITMTSNGVAVIEASSMGWPPGRRPAAVRVGTSNFTFLRERRHANGDVICWIYHNVIGDQLHVIND